MQLSYPSLFDLRQICLFGVVLTRSISQLFTSTPTETPSEFGTKRSLVQIQSPRLEV